MHVKDRNGFTILEILIALSILATVLSIVFTSYTATFRIIGETESQAEIYQMARIALERIIEDLACTLPEDTKTSKSKDTDEESGFSGENEDIQGRSADSMRFRSWAHLVFSEPGEEGGGLPLCKKLVSVDFTYRDDDWEDHDDWEEEGIPRLVSVSLEFINPSNPEAPLKFATNVALRTSTVKKK